MYRGKHTIVCVVLVVTFAALVVMVTGCERKETAKAEEIKTAMRRVHDEAWTRGKMEVLDKYYAANFVRHIPPFPDIKGLDAYRQYMAKVRADYSDIQIALHAIIVESLLGSHPTCITRRPRSRSAMERLDETVLFPIPPLPYTAICRIYHLAL